MELTGLDDNPKAAKKITLLIFLSLFVSFAVAWWTVASIDSMGEFVVDVMNNMRQTPTFEPYTPPKIE